MRIIIEVDSKKELEEALALLQNREVEVRERPLSREVRLKEMFSTYDGRLPEGYCFDREEAHER